MTDLPHLKARPLSRFYGLMTSKLGVSTPVTRLDSCL